MELSPDFVRLQREGEAYKKEALILEVKKWEM